VSEAVCTKPAVLSPPAAATNAATPAARSAGEASAVAGSNEPAEVSGAGVPSPGQSGSGRPQPGSGEGRGHEVGERVGAAAGGRRRRRPAAVDGELQVHRDPLVGDVLVDRGVGEAGQRERGLLDAHGGLGVGPGLGADLVQDRGGEVVEVGAHPRTPTRTPEKRAGAAPWPVCPTCPGCPLPQLGVPHALHSPGAAPPSMSSDCQNRGPMPV
jgi:hypothetical protein